MKNYRIVEITDDKFSWFHIEYKHWFWGWNRFYVEGWVSHNYSSIERCRGAFDSYCEWYHNGKPDYKTTTIHKI